MRSFPRIFLPFDRPRATLLLAPVLGLLALVSGCGGDGNNPTTPTQGSNVAITNGASTKTTDAFSPNPDAVSLAAGGGVVWTNQDTQTTGTGGGNPTGGGGGGGPYGARVGLSLHSLAGTTHNIVADDGSYNSGPLAPGATFTHAFTAAGSYPYHCSIHPNMRGTITVNP
jgi:plastocyanin